MKKFIIIALLVLGLASTGFAGNWDTTSILDEMSDARTDRAFVISTDNKALMYIDCDYREDKGEISVIFNDTGIGRLFSSGEMILRVDDKKAKSFGVFANQGHMAILNSADDFFKYTYKGSNLKVKLEDFVGNSPIRKFSLQDLEKSLNFVMKACGRPDYKVKVKTNSFSREPMDSFSTTEHKPYTNF